MVKFINFEYILNFIKSLDISIDKAIEAAGITGSEKIKYISLVEEAIKKEMA